LVARRLVAAGVLRRGLRLVLAYATYWYAGVPYYYANDVYYTWSPDYDGYVATDPPPVGDPNGAAAGPDAPQPAPPAPQYAPPQYTPPQAPQYAPPPAGGQADPGLNLAPAPGTPQSAPQPPPPEAQPNATPAPSFNPTSAGVQARLNMYPKNGQSPGQESIDRRDCQQWAAQHAGTSAANGSDFQRAMVACVEGRGYAVD
jgi:hypothetical protein